MTDFTITGSSGFDTFRITPGGAVYHDPQGNGGGWAEDAVTETGTVALVRDVTTGALALAEISVDVTGPTSAPTYATDGMTASATWDVVGAYYYDLSPSTVASARITGSRQSGDEGILHEAGGGQIGLLVYVYDDTLYFRCGGGGDKDPTGRADVGYITAPAPTGDFVVEWSASAATGKAALYVDGTLVGTATFSYAQIAGVNEGAIGVAGDGPPANLGLWGADEGTFEGTVTEAIVYVGQVTAEVEA